MAIKDFSGIRILLLDGLTSQCLEYVKAFNALGCDTSVLCNDRFDTAYASRHPNHKILGICGPQDLKGTEEWIHRLVCSGGYDVVIPFTEYSAAILAHHKPELAKYAHLIVNDPEVFDRAQDKNEVMRTCMECGIPCPETVFHIEKVDDILRAGVPFPLILKPRHGFGAHGFHLVNELKELTAIVRDFHIHLSDMVVQEYIPKGSLNISANLFLDHSGTVQSSFLYASHRFYPLDGGSGVLNITFDRKDVHALCARLAAALNLRGPVGIDLIVDKRDDVPKVLEVNLRPIACAKLGFLAGVDQARQILEDLYCDAVTPMLSYRTGIRVRRSQMDWLWFLKSPDRFCTRPSWFDRRNTTDQLFAWDDPGPWFAFWVYGLRKYLREKQALRSQKS